MEVRWSSAADQAQGVCLRPELPDMAEVQAALQGFEKYALPKGPNAWQAAHTAIACHCSARGGIIGVPHTFSPRDSRLADVMTG